MKSIHSLPTPGISVLLSAVSPLSARRRSLRLTHSHLKAILPAILLCAAFAADSQGRKHGARPEPEKIYESAGDESKVYDPLDRVKKEITEWVKTLGEQVKLLQGDLEAFATAAESRKKTRGTPEQRLANFAVLAGRRFVAVDTHAARLSNYPYLQVSGRSQEEIDAFAKAAGLVAKVAKERQAIAKKTGLTSDQGQVRGVIQCARRRE